MLIAAFDILLCGICSVYVKFSHNSFLTHFILIVFQYFSKFRAPVIDLSVVVCLTIATILHKPTKLQDFTHLYVDQMWNCKCSNLQVERNCERCWCKSYSGRNHKAF